MTSLISSVEVIVDCVSKFTSLIHAQNVHEGVWHYVKKERKYDLELVTKYSPLVKNCNFATLDCSYSLSL